MSLIRLIYLHNRYKQTKAGVSKATKQCTTPMMPTILLLLSVFSVSLFPSCFTTVTEMTYLGYGFAINNMVRESERLEKFVKDRNYPIERHIFVSQDGYVLLYHRVRHSTPAVESARTETAHRHPVLIMHGILQSSAFYLSIEDGLAYQLADAGFDVWLGNHRGSPFSQAHMHLNPALNAKYWEFSFDEMGKYDLPAAVDLILSQTNKATITYIGFSMGTTMFWIFAHYWPDYQSKVDRFYAMAPIAIPTGLKIVMIRPLYGLIATVLKSLNVVRLWEFRPSRRLMSIFVQEPCGRFTGKPNIICKVILKIVCVFSGMRETLLDYRVALTSLDFMSAGSSLQSLYHLLQVGSAGRFLKYDYGDRLNLLYYNGHTKPSEYDLSRVTTSVYLIQGGKDEYSTPGDTKRLREHLLWCGNKDVHMFLEDEGKEYNHLDFFFATGVNDKLNKPLVSNIKLHALNLNPS